jgi:hypothetical protein
MLSQLWLQYFSRGSLPFVGAATNIQYHHWMGNCIFPITDYEMMAEQKSSLHFYLLVVNLIYMHFEMTSCQTA